MKNLLSVFSFPSQTVLSALKPNRFLNPSYHYCTPKIVNNLFHPSLIFIKSHSTIPFTHTLSSFKLINCTHSIQSKAIVKTAQRNSNKFSSYNKVPLYLESAKYIIPYPTKKNNGDDAAFCSPWHLAVADGVGSWGFSGIDPGLYSRELIERISSILHNGNENQNPTPSPVHVMREAYKNIKSIGSTTCCLVFLDSWNKQIKTANLGDSGFILYRPSANKIVCRSEFQSHSFNFPLQLGTGSTDGPSDAQQLQFSVTVDDWIVVGTDGLWDNLYDQQIIDLIQNSTNSTTAAQSIAKKAFRLSLDRNWDSPFSSKEREQIGTNGNRFGGKPDDISVVVAHIRKPEDRKNN